MRTVSSYIKTTGAAASRAAESLAFTFTARPQALSLYIRFVEHGTILTVDGVVSIGGTTGGRLIIESNASSLYQASYVNNLTGGSATSALGARPSISDVVELLATLTATGIVQIQQSVNGAAVTSGASSSAIGLGTAWNAQQLFVGSLSGTPGDTGLLAATHLLVLRGVATMAQCQRLAGV